MKTKHLVIGALGLALVAVLGLVALEPAAPVVASGGTSNVASAPSTTAVRFPWAEGVRSVYALSWQSETGGLIAPTQAPGAGVPGAGVPGAAVGAPAAGPQAAPAGRTEKMSIQAETEVEGEVVVEGLGRSGDGFLAAVSYGEIRRFAFRLQGHDAVEDEAAVARELTGHQAFVTFSPRGEAVAIAFAPQLPAATQTALRSLVAQLQWTLPPADAQEWSAVERDAVGKVRVAYRRDGNQFHRTPVAFESLDAVPGAALDGQQELQGDALLSVDEGGLSSINERIHVRYTRRGGKEPAVSAGWTFSLERLRQERFDTTAVRALAQGPARPFGPPVADEQLGARRDERLARNVTVDSIMLDIDHFEAGQKPAHDQVIRAGAYLRLHPEAAAALVEKFQSADLTVKGRGYILDVLAQAGDAPAQAALRAALETPAAQARPRDFSLLVQRFTFVVAPEPESAEFLERQLDQARGTRDVAAAQGAAVALGSTVRRLAELGREDEARRYDARLRDDLAYAKDAQLQRGLLAALGNAARLDDVDAIRAHSGSGEPLVRDQVASSLRHLDSAGSRATLLQLAQDAHSTVAVSAFSSLRTQTMNAAEWAALAAVVTAGKTPVAADSALVALVREKRAIAGAAGDAILGTLLARNGGGDNDLGPIILQMLSPP